MKLIYCPTCHDVCKLQMELTTCECGASSGRYIGNLHATINSHAIPLGFANPSLISALIKRPDYGLGTVFTAFVIERNCPTIKVIE